MASSENKKVRIGVVGCGVVLRMRDMARPIRKRSAGVYGWESHLMVRWGGVGGERRWGAGLSSEVVVR